MSTDGCHTDCIQVIDYLNKKGYTRTEAVLRAESANQEIPKEVDLRPQTVGPPKYLQAYARLAGWADDALEIYKAEVQRLLWPIFVYSYLALVQKFYAKEANHLCNKCADLFRKEHEYDLRSLERISLPEHTEGDNIAKVYRGTSIACRYQRRHTTTSCNSLRVSPRIYTSS